MHLMDLIAYVGMIISFGSYFALCRGKVRDFQYRYHLMVLGSGLLLMSYAIHIQAWPYVVFDLAWILESLRKMWYITRERNLLVWSKGRALAS